MRWFEQQTYIYFLLFWRLEVQDQMLAELVLVRTHFLVCKCCILRWQREHAPCIF